MKKTNCIPCEIQGIEREATCEIYIDVIGGFTYVCEEHRIEYIKEQANLENQRIDKDYDC